MRSHLATLAAGLARSLAHAAHTAGARLRPAWVWWSTTTDPDPVQRTINCGFAGVLAAMMVAIGINLLQTVLISSWHRYSMPLALMQALAGLAWWLNRRGGPAGAYCFAITSMGVVMFCIPPSSYLYLDSSVIPVEFLAPMIIATLFGHPRAGVWVCALNLALLTLVLIFDSAPADARLHFLLTASLRLSSITVLLIAGAALFRRALLAATVANDQLTQLNAELEQRVAARTADLAAAHAAIIHRDALRSQEVSASTHDLLGGLQRIQNAVDDLLDAVVAALPAARVRTHQQRIATTMQAMQELVLVMRDAVLLEHGRLVLVPQATDLLTLLGQITLQFDTCLRAAACQLTLHIDEAVPPVWCDPARLRRVLINLIDNAVKYTRLRFNDRPGGQISIALAVTDEHVHCRIQDNGVGIAPERIAELGQPFHRLSSSARAPVGMGLGLHFCRWILSESGGSLVLSSAGNGAGTTVQLTLPRAPVATPAPAYAVGAGRCQRGEPCPTC